MRVSGVCGAASEGFLRKGKRALIFSFNCMPAWGKDCDLAAFSLNCRRFSAFRVSSSITEYPAALFAWGRPTAITSLGILNENRGAPPSLRLGGTGDSGTGGGDRMDKELGIGGGVGGNSLGEENCKERGVAGVRGTGLVSGAGLVGSGGLRSELGLK
jgi:hypothetical protein